MYVKDIKRIMNVDRQQIKQRSLIKTHDHRNSQPSVGVHFCDKHSLAPKNLTKNFSVLIKCTNKFDCLIHEMSCIHELRSTQSFKGKASLFVLLSVSIVDSFDTLYIHTYIYIYIYIRCFNFYLLVDKDQSKVETLPFSIDFIKIFYEILANFIY